VFYLYDLRKEDQENQEKKQWSDKAKEEKLCCGVQDIEKASRDGATAATEEEEEEQQQQQQQQSFLYMCLLPPCLVLNCQQDQECRQSGRPKQNVCLPSSTNRQDQASKSD
jgi:hypothetical protein